MSTRSTTLGALLAALAMIGFGVLGITTVAFPRRATATVPPPVQNPCKTSPNPFEGVNGPSIEFCGTTNLTVSRHVSDTVDIAGIGFGSPIQLQQICLVPVPPHPSDVSCGGKDELTLSQQQLQQIQKLIQGGNGEFLLQSFPLTAVQAGTSYKIRFFYTTVPMPPQPLSGISMTTLKVISPLTPTPIPVHTPTPKSTPSPKPHASSNSPLLLPAILFELASLAILVVSVARPGSTRPTQSHRQ